MSNPMHGGDPQKVRASALPFFLSPLQPYHLCAYAKKNPHTANHPTMNQRNEKIFVECYNCKQIVQITLAYNNDILRASDFCPKCLKYIEPVNLRPIVIIPRNPFNKTASK